MESFYKNVALLDVPLIGVHPGGSISFGGKLPEGEFDVVFLEGVEKATLVLECSYKVVILETRADKMGAFLSCELAQKCLQTGRLQLAFAPQLLELAWQHVFMRYHCESPELESVLRRVHAIASDYRDCGVAVYKNLVRNASIPMRCGKKLKGAFSGVPAIVCGAGPSLVARPDVSGALVFACGSAMGLVKEYHFGVALDPDPPRDRFLRSSMHGAPLIVQNRVSHQLLCDNHGPLISLPPNGNYPIEERVYGERGEFASGWNAGTFGVALAHMMGCDPIYVTGIDGGVVEGKRYAEGLSGGGPLDDLAFGKEWMEAFSPRPLAPLTKRRDIGGQVGAALARLEPLMGVASEVEASRKRCAALLDNLLAAFAQEHKGKQLLYETELSREVFYEYHFEPVFAIWRWMIEREEGNRVNCTSQQRMLKKALFFQHVMRNCHVG